MFIILETGYLQLWALYKSDLRISSARKHIGMIRIKHFWTYIEQQQYISHYRLAGKNRTLTPLHWEYGGSHGITFTVPLSDNLEMLS